MEKIFLFLPCVVLQSPTNLIRTTARMHHQKSLWMPQESLKFEEKCLRPGSSQLWETVYKVVLGRLRELAWTLAGENCLRRLVQEGRHAFLQGPAGFERGSGKA